MSVEDRRDGLLTATVFQAQQGDQRSIDWVLGRALALDELRARAEHRREEVEAKLVRMHEALQMAQQMNRRLQEGHAAAFHFTTVEMRGIVADADDLWTKAKREGKADGEAIGLVIGQTLTRLGYSSPGSER
jgi:hypothetical protein